MLYLFTSSFPYGNGEGFLEMELPYLAHSFEKITIVPGSYEGMPLARKVPGNVEVLPVISDVKIRYKLYRIFDVPLYKFFIRDFFQKGVLNKRRQILSLITNFILISCILHSKVICEIKNKLKQDDICYFYWGTGAYCLSYFWRGKAHFISRFHGSADLWEQTPTSYKPFRKDIINNLDCAYSVSKKGELYLKNLYPYANIRTSRLGTLDLGETSKSKDGIFRLLSCSFLRSIKRVDLILKAVLSIKGVKIEWTHIGDGDEYQRLIDLSKENNNPDVNITFTGHMTHNKVMDYYRTHCVDGFINLSTIEGVPVSIMEAISFNIPVIATNVGATSEIVTEETGILLDANPTIDDVCEALLTIRTKNLTPRRYWMDNYTATTNYNDFISQIKKYESKSLSCD